MKLKLFDETEIEIKSAIEINQQIIINIPLNQKNEYADIFSSITDANLSNVMIVNDDNSESSYSNLKFVSGTLMSQGKYSVELILSNKSEFEMKVSELEKELTRTQTALAEIYETLL